MLAKLITSGRDRDAAIARAVRALRDFPILGVRTNGAFLIRLLQHDDFRAGDIDTGFVERHAAGLTSLTSGGDIPAAVSAAAEFAAADGVPARAGASGGASEADPWSRFAGWGR